jgi:hypothetical protein
MYPSQEGHVTWVSGSKGEVLRKRNTINGGDIPKYVCFFNIEYNILPLYSI